MIRRHSVRALLVALACTSVAPAARGASPYDDPEGSAWLGVHGLADVFLQHDLNQPRSNQVAYRAFDDQSDVPALNLLRITLEHRPEWLGFRIDVGAGALADTYLGGDPAASQYPTLSRALSYAEQAFGTALLPLGRGLSVDVGKFGTPIGFEANETLANWNYSRSLLFTLAEPSYHAGVRATLPLTEQLAVSAFWLNGWDTNVLDGNGMRSFGFGLAWSSGSGVDLSAVYVAGPEHALTQPTAPSLGFRQVVDASASWSPRTWLTVAATVDDGAEATGGGVDWWGVGGYLRSRFLPWLVGTARAEHLDDATGFLTSTRQRLVEGTLTLESTETLGVFQWVTRLEVRRDQSDEPVFPTGALVPIVHQDTVTIGMMAAF